MRISRAAKFYQERRGLLPTYRRPLSTYDPNDRLTHTYPLAPSYPLAGYLIAWRPAPEPDMPRRVVWNNALGISQAR